MKRKLVLSIISLVLCICILTTLTYAWWINGVFDDDLNIRSANISSSITLYKGLDYDSDGYLDVVDENNAAIDPYVLVEEQLDAEKHVLSFSFDSIYPTAVYTWKIVVENNGDADGYLTAMLSETISEEALSIFQYMYITSSVAISDTQTKVTAPAFLNERNKVLFGGTEDDIIYYSRSKGNTKEYIVQIVLAPLDSFENIDNDIYQTLQGNKLDLFDLMQISLSSTPPTTT